MLSSDVLKIAAVLWHSRHTQARTELYICPFRKELFSHRCSLHVQQTQTGRHDALSYNIQSCSARLCSAHTLLCAELCSALCPLRCAACCAPCAVICVPCDMCFIYPALHDGGVPRRRDGQAGRELGGCALETKPADKNRMTDRLSRRVCNGGGLCMKRRARACGVQCV
jgi:hypothetical protein